MNLKFWLRHPRAILHQMRYKLWQYRHPDYPWLCPGTVAALQGYLKPTHRMWEFGSGRSTLWFARHVGTLISIEHNTPWFQTVQGQLVAAKVQNAELRLIPLDHPETEPEADHYEPLPRYVAQLLEEAPASLDVLLVDGHYRTTCIRAGLDRLKPGGWLVVDDAQMWPSLAAMGIPSHWILRDQSTNGVKRAVIVERPGPGS